MQTTLRGKTVLTLRKLQSHFSDYLLHPEGSTNETLADSIVTNGFTAKQRLQIYRNNTHITLTEALEAIYPVIAQLVSEEFFHYAAKAYIEKYPCKAGNLHDFGGQLAEFLATFEPTRNLEYLPDIARLEWFIHESYHSADAGVSILEKLAQTAPDKYEDTRFKLHPAVRIMASDYPVYQIWQAHQQEDLSSIEPIDIGCGGENLLVYRKIMDTQIMPLKEHEYYFLYALQQGATLAGACEPALENNPEFSPAEYLQYLINECVVVDCQ